MKCASAATPPSAHLRVLREAGGLGDVVRVLPVLTGLRRRHPTAELWVWGLGPYEPIFTHGGCGDHFVPVALAERRPRDAFPDPAAYAYLNRSDSDDPLPEFDQTIDLYCPAFRHEVETEGAPSQDRIQLFCRAAGVRAGRPRYHVRPEERAGARQWLDRSGTGAAPVKVGLQPFSTAAIRNWPAARWQELAGRLIGAGRGVVVFDRSEGRLRGFPGAHCAGPPLPGLAALVAEMDLMITPDSGLFHLAGAVDTPGLGLFGSTNGPLIAKWYPKSRVIQGHPARGRLEPGECKAPCYMFRSRGYDPGLCPERGCAALNAVTVDEVYHAADKML